MVHMCDLSSAHKTTDKLILKEREFTAYIKYSKTVHDYISSYEKEKKDTVLNTLHYHYDVHTFWMYERKSLSRVHLCG